MRSWKRERKKQIWNETKQKTEEKMWKGKCTHAHVKEEQNKNKIEPSMLCCVVLYGLLKSLFGLDCVRSSNMFTPYWPISSLNANSLNFQCIPDIYVCYCIIYCIDDSDAPISINKSIWFMCMSSEDRRLWSTYTW